MMACSSERISKSRARSRRVARSDSALNVHVNSSDSSSSLGSLTACTRRSGSRGTLELKLETSGP